MPRVFGTRRRGIGRPVALAALVATALALVVLGTAGPAAAGFGERIRSFDVDVVVGRDGAMTITETIVYDFGNAFDRHGIFRDIQVREYYDDRYDRITPLDRVSVKGGPGTPDGVDRSKVGPFERLRIGDADKTVTGPHTYEISYRIRGGLNSFDTHEELYWDITGNGWSVPIDSVRVRVTAPGGVGDAVCFAGPAGSSLGCDEVSFGGSEAVFAQTDLLPGAGVTVAVAMPKGSVTVGPPILDERWSIQRAFELTPLTGGVAAGATALVVFGLGRMAWVQGRDRRWRGSPVDVVFGADDGTDEAVPLSLYAAQPDPMEFIPPEGILPGQLGTLIDEVANPLDVTATIVHLAVRGYIRIEEIPKKGLFGKTDWRLHKLKGPGGLRGYEKQLLAGLFQSGTKVKLSSLKQAFSARLKKVQDALYDDCVGQGWFAARPDKVRWRWVFIGILLLVLAAVVTIVLAASTHLGLLGIPFLVAGVMVLALASKMPRRTPKGVAMVRRVYGFRRFIVDSEAERARFAERANIFSEYLPYAIVFGATEKWAQAFEGLDELAADATSSWYVSSRPFSMGGFSDSMSDFAVSAGGTISASAPSSSGGSGFGGGGSSGGGGGGGGGGSW